MGPWEGFPLERLVVLFLAVAYLVVWAQLTLLHWRAAFRKWEMWGPVLYTPILVFSAGLYAVFRSDATGTIFLWTYVIGVLEGLFGTLLHLNGVRKMVGGLNLRNFALGPPIFLPIAYAALAALGAIVYWYYRGVGA